MCYSALIKASLKEVSASFRALVDLEEFRHLFDLRLADATVKIPRGIDRYFLESQDPQEVALAPLIRQFHLEEKERTLIAIGGARQEIRDLQQKPTAANRKKIEVRERRLIKLGEKMALKLDEPSHLDQRVYPHWYAPVVVEEKGQRRLMPMRYRVRGPDGVDIPDKYNTFNSRLDSLRAARTWIPLFGRTHVIFPFVHFYEWVERGGVKKEIFFSPEGRDFMWAAGLFSVAKNKEKLPLYSFAMVTDDPPPEISQAGHDRCPIFLAEPKISAWLNPENLAPDELLLLLKNIEKPYYSNGLAA